MRELIIRCDRCGGLIEGDPITLATESRKDKWMLPAEQHPDLCKDCADQVVKWIYKKDSETSELNVDGKAVKLCWQQADEEPATEPEAKQEEVEAKKEQPKKKRRPLDGGKIRALRRAGWTQKQIAEELGTSAQSIASWIYKNGEGFEGEA